MSLDEVKKSSYNLQYSKDFNRVPTARCKRFLLLWGLTGNIYKAFDSAYSARNNYYMQLMRHSPRHIYWRDKLVREHLLEMGCSNKELVNMAKDYVVDTKNNGDEARKDMLLKLMEMAGIYNPDSGTQVSMGVFTGGLNHLPVAKDVDQIESGNGKDVEFTEEVDASEEQSSVSENAGIIREGANIRETVE